MSERPRLHGARWLLLLAAVCGNGVPIVQAPTSLHALDGVEEPLMRAGRRHQGAAAIRRRSGAARPLPGPIAPLRARLQAAGLTATVQRQQVLALLIARDRAPISGRDIYRRLDYAVSQVTIQRVLGQFESAGIVECVDHLDDRHAYRLRA